MPQTPNLLDTPFMKSVSAQEKKALKFIAEYPLDKVRERLRRDGVVPARKMDEAIAEFRKFLALVMLYPTEPMGMTSDYVDEVWHTFILFTQEYSDFTTKVYGQYLHHDPSTSQEPVDAACADNFALAYQTVYGKVPTIWGLNGTCAVHASCKGAAAKAECKGTLRTLASCKGVAAKAECKGALKAASCKGIATKAECKGALKTSSCKGAVKAASCKGAVTTQASCKGAVKAASCKGAVTTQASCKGAVKAASCKGAVARA